MDFEAFILNIVNSITEANYNAIGAVVIVIGLVFWIVVSSWIWIDADERTTSKWMRIFYLVIGIVPVLGWIIYLIIRPPETIDEIYWGDLERRYLKYEAKDLGDCPKCGTQLYPGYVYCPNCGERIKRKCSSCGMYVDLEYKYCPYCGKQMAKRSQQEKEINQKEMQKQIEETKNEVHETVKSKRSKYKQEQNFIRRVEESVVKGYKLLNKKIKGVFNKPKVNEKDKESSKKGNGNKK